MLYSLMIIVHIVAAFALVGPLMLAPLSAKHIKLHGIKTHLNRYIN